MKTLALALATAATLLAVHGAEPAGAPWPEWRGVCRVQEGWLFSLSGRSGAGSAWLRVGESGLDVKVVRFDPATMTLLLQRDRDTHEATLETATAHPALPALPKAEALSYVRHWLDGLLRGPLQATPKDQQSARQRGDIEALATREAARMVERARVLDLNSGSLDPLPPHEVSAELARQDGAVIFSRTETHGAPHTIELRKLTLNQFPAHVRANLTQEDLDSTLPEQIALARAALQAHDAPAPAPPTPSKP